MTSKMDHGGSNAVRALLLLVASAVMPQSAFAAEQLGIELDQATIMKLPEKVSTIVIGNPLIADVAVQSGGLVVVTGKGYGTTNLIVLDRTGGVLMERSVVVRAAKPGPQPRGAPADRRVARPPEGSRRLSGGEDPRRRQCR